MTRAALRDEALDLQVARATEGLGATDLARLESLVARDSSLADGSIELAAAVLDLACLGDIEPLPAAVASKVRRQAAEFSQRSDLARVTPMRSRTQPTASEPVRARSAWLPWGLAAASLVAAVLGWWRPTVDPAVQPDGPPRAASVELKRQLLIDAAGDLTRLDWTATEDAAATGASGDVVWSNERQQGYMRFAGLQINDPTEFQYQLWIFDASRDDRHPIDGGLFDVGAGEVVVPIDARLRVDRAVLFAVTIEKPGGVVVSNRERIVTLAQVG